MPTKASNDATKISYIGQLNTGYGKKMNQSEWCNLTVSTSLKYVLLNILR